MKQIEVAAYLKGIPLFSTLDDEKCMVLADKATQTSKKAGQTLIREGDTLTKVFIFMEGGGVLYFLQPDGKKTVVQHIRPNKAFPVETALMGSRQSGNIEVVQDAMILGIPVDLVLELMRTDAAFACQVARHSMDLALRLTDLLKDLSFNATARLGRYLFRRALEASSTYGEGVTFDLGLRKGVLADYLGITPATLSRMFNQLQGEGVISIKGSTVIVRSVRDLVRLSEGFYCPSQGADY